MKQIGLRFYYRNFQNAVDKMMQKQDLTVLVSTGSWAEQFTEALTVSAGMVDKAFTDFKYF